MAKRHHGMRVSEGDYAGEGARKRMEKHDGAMIHDDMSAVANLPQNVMYKPWEREHSYMPEHLEDDIRSVDRQIGMDTGKRNAKLHPKKV
jgi:hypothetical protein